MYKNKTILAIITARGGSKGIPNKNIKPLAGEPLINYTVKAAKGSNYLTRCILSTDSEKITEVAKVAGVEILFMRPSKLAGDNSTSLEVVQHALQWLSEKEQKEYDYVMILQPTSPLRTAEDIDLSIKKIVDTDADSVMGMKELVDFSLKKIKVIEDDLILPSVEAEEGISSRRQDLKKLYKRNCAIYLTKTELIKKGDLFGKVSRPYIMPEERSLDINIPFDFELAEYLILLKK